MSKAALEKVSPGLLTAVRAYTVKEASALLKYSDTSVIKLRKTGLCSEKMLARINRCFGQGEPEPKTDPASGDYLVPSHFLRVALSDLGITELQFENLLGLPAGAVPAYLESGTCPLYVRAGASGLLAEQEGLTRRRGSGRPKGSANGHANGSGDGGSSVEVLKVQVPPGHGAVVRSLLSSLGYVVSNN